MRCDGVGPDSASPQPVMARASSLRTAISQRVASEPERDPDRPADRARRRLGATSCTVIPAVYASSTRRVHARVRGGAGGDLVLLGAPFPPCSISRLASHPSASRVGLRVRAWAYARMDEGASVVVPASSLTCSHILDFV